MACFMWSQCLLALGNSREAVKQLYMAMAVTWVARVPEATQMVEAATIQTQEESLCNNTRDYQSIKKPDGFYNSNSSFCLEIEYFKRWKERGDQWLEEIRDTDKIDTIKVTFLKLAIIVF